MALRLGAIGPLLFHGFFVKYNIEKVWKFIPPPLGPRAFSTPFPATLHAAGFATSLFAVHPSPSTNLAGM